MSPLLLENSNKARNTLNQALGSLIRGPRFDWSVETSQVTWSTPKKSTELKAQTVEFQRLQEQDQFTRRLLFRKILKGFEVQESVLADQELKYSL
jgi:hypothetical protein